MMVKVDCCEHGNLIGQWCFKCPEFEAIGCETKKLRAAEAEIESLKSMVETLEARTTELAQELDDWRNREAACCPEDTPFEDEIKALRAKVESLEAEAKHWKANHADMVERCRELRERPDLQDRVRSVMALRERAEKAEAALQAAEAEANTQADMAVEAESKLRALEGAALEAADNLVDARESLKFGSHEYICAVAAHDVLRDALGDPCPAKREIQETPTSEAAIRSLLCRAAIRGWRRGRRNQDPAQEEIADDLLLEAGAAPEEEGANAQ